MNLWGVAVLFLLLLMMELCAAPYGRMTVSKRWARAQVQVAFGDTYWSLACDLRYKFRGICLN